MHDTLDVKVDENHWVASPLSEARTQLERRLGALGERAAARVATEAPERRLPGRVGKREVEFTCVAAENQWAAVWMRGRLGVTVTGIGAAPERLELDRLKASDVDPSHF